MGKIKNFIACSSLVLLGGAWVAINIDSVENWFGGGRAQKRRHERALYTAELNGLKPFIENVNSGDNDKIPRLVKIAEGNYPGYSREMAVEAIGNIRTEKAYDALIKLGGLRTVSPESLGKALGKTRGKKAIHEYVGRIKRKEDTYNKKYEKAVAFIIAEGVVPSPSDRYYLTDRFADYFDVSSQMNCSLTPYAKALYRLDKGQAEIFARQIAARKGEHELSNYYFRHRNDTCVPMIVMDLRGRRR